MRKLVSSLLKRPHYTLRIIRPVCFRIRNQLVQTGLDNAQLFKIRRIEAELSVLSVSYNSIGSECQRAWKYMAAVIICVFSDQIHTPRSKVRTDLPLSLEQFLKLLNQSFLHHFSPPFIYVVYLYYSCIFTLLIL